MIRRSSLDSVLGLGLLLSLLGLASPASAASLQVAVMQLGARNADPQLVQSFSDALATELGKQEGIEIRTDSELRMMMNFEASRQVLGCDGDECYSQLGQMLAVDRLVSGNIAGLGKGYFVSLSLIDVGDGQVKSRTSYQIEEGDQALIASAKQAATELLALPARLTLSGQVPGGRVFLADRLVGVMPVDTLLLRDHQTLELRVEHPDYPPYREALQVVPGEATQVQLGLLSYQERRERTRRRRWSGVAMSLIASGVVAGSGLLYLDGWDQKRAYDAVDPRSVTQAQLDDMAAGSRLRIGAGSAGLGAGAVLLGAGLYYLIANPYRFEPPRKSSSQDRQVAQEEAR